MKYDAIIVASGKGERAQLGYNKILYKLKNGKTVLEESCHLFLDDEDCEKVIIVTNETININDNKVVCVKGGKERKDSVCNGLKEAVCDYVMIHDGARPFLSLEELNRLKESLYTEDACILAIKATDTIKKCKDGYIKKTIDRENIYRALTPQAFKKDLIIKAYEKTNNDNIVVTDDASAMEYCGYKVKIVDGNKNNIKLTSKEDFINI